MFWPALETNNIVFTPRRPALVSGGRGWVGLRLDDGVDWGEVEVVGEEAYRAVAPKRLVALLEVTPAPDIGRVEGC